jgi:hypothetical protein
MRNNATQIADKRLDFVVRFANLSLDRLRPSEWPKLRNDMEHFFSSQKGEFAAAPVFTATVVGIDIADYPARDFKTLQGEIRPVLKMLTNASFSGPLPTSRIEMELGFYGKRSARWIHGDGQLRDCFLMAMFFALTASGNLDKLRQCPAPSCSNFFRRNRKQSYCSPRCNARAYMRKYRLDDSVKGKESDARHERYVANVKKSRPGKKTKVIRRQRKQA